MQFIRFALAAVLATGLFSAASAADAPGYRAYAKQGKFENVRDDLKDAIVNKGFVIDYTGHFGDMMERTAAVAAPGKASPYAKAEYIQFCPAKLTHEGAALTPFAVANCPVAVFAFELKSKPGEIQVGYRLPMPLPGKDGDAVNARMQALLDEIVKAAAK